MMLNAILQLESQEEGRESAMETVFMVVYTSETLAISEVAARSRYRDQVPKGEHPERTSGTQEFVS